MAAGTIVVRDSRFGRTTAASLRIMGMRDSNAPTALNVAFDAMLIHVAHTQFEERAMLENRTSSRNPYQ